MTEAFTAAMSARIRSFEGQTPLQALSRRGPIEPSPMTSLERFPYYRAFPFAWYFGAYSDEVAVGEVKTVRWLARDLVVWRDEEGAAHVMDAYCPHMGAHLGYGGRVEGCNLICPYHWWEYDGDGNNVRIPYADQPNRKARVRSYPTIDRNGLIMFWFHPRGEAPMWEIPELAEANDPTWTAYLRGEWDVRCPWQEMAENGPDYIHLRTVHGAADVPEVESLEYEGYLSRLRSKVNFATPRGPQAGRIDTDSWGPGFAVARFSGITPALFVNLSTPIDWERTRSIKLYKLEILGDSEEARSRTERVGDALVRDLRRQMEEDIVIFDHKVWVDPPALAPDDGPIVRFRKWAQHFYVDGDPVAADRARPSRTP
jgi:nitrite reductase/ring-hydroxylating ferredoxin subunit